MQSDAGRIAGVGRVRWLTGARQSMRSWAIAVESYDDLPQVYRSFFAPSPSSDGPFPYAVLTPRYEGFLRREQEKLVFCPDSSLYVLQARGNQVLPTVFPLGELHYLEVGSFLLKSWIDLRGRSNQGLLTTTLRFNTVSERLFGPLLGKIRGGSLPATGADPDAERAKLREVAGLSLKLLNYGKSSILPGDRVLDAIWQPEIREEWLSRLGKRLARTRSTAHLSILTGRELILIRDNPSKDSKYGATRTFVPLDRIRSVSLAEKKDGLLAASLHLPENDRLDLLYSESNRTEIERFLEQVSR